MSRTPLSVTIERHSRDSSRPAHHDPPSLLSSVLPLWDSEESKNPKPTRGFHNPWPSWHKPSMKEVWDSFQWGEDPDPCIKLAASHLEDEHPASLSKPDPKMLPNFSGIEDWPHSTPAQAARLLRWQKPDFSFDGEKQRSKVTWLGHAGILLQVPGLKVGGAPIRALFDPIFSMRCSPSQAVGPARSYPPPCKVEDLPPIDLVFISHSHYDHLDYDTVIALWKGNKQRIRFFVPLGNKDWFIEQKIDGERVTEMDWWDTARLSDNGDGGGNEKEMKINCTPAQHSSGRVVSDAGSTLWCGWYLTLQHTDAPYRIYFAGDTGYQFHDKSSWPPPPPSLPLTPDSRGTYKNDNAVNGKYPTCPIFTEIKTTLGAPNLLLLPIAVGATYSYVRSWVWLPDSVSPFPRHDDGLTAAIHMPAWDSVRAMKDLTDADTDGKGGVEHDTVAVAIHWGTFVPDAVEVLKTLGQLEWACHAHGIDFGRALPESEKGAHRVFLAVNHGQSIST